MTKPEILTVLLSLKALLETKNEKKALEVIDEVIDEVRHKPRQEKPQRTKNE